MLGVLGALLAIPIAAAIQVIVFRYFKGAAGNAPGRRGGFAGLALDAGLDGLRDGSTRAGDERRHEDPARDHAIAALRQIGGPRD